MMLLVLVLGELFVSGSSIFRASCLFFFFFFAVQFLYTAKVCNSRAPRLASFFLSIAICTYTFCIYSIPQDRNSKLRTSFLHKRSRSPLALYTSSRHHVVMLALILVSQIMTSRGSSSSSPTAGLVWVVTSNLFLVSRSQFIALASCRPPTPTPRSTQPSNADQPELLILVLHLHPTPGSTSTSSRWFFGGLR